MIDLRSYRRFVPILVVAGIAAVIIGCGGGGGGGGTSATATATTSTATATATTSTATATATATATTSTATATASTAGSTPPGQGVLPPNVILYIRNNQDGTYNVMQVNPDGTKNVPFISNLPSTVRAIAANPIVRNQYALAIDSTNNTADAIWLATVSSSGVVSGQTQLTGWVYSYKNGGGVSSLGFSQDGTKIVYTASNTSDLETDLYFITTNGGLQSPAPLDINAQQVSIGQDSNTIVYTKPVNNLDTQLFMGTLSAFDSNAVQITSDAAIHDYPQISRDGKSVVYSSLPDSDQTLEYHLATLSLVTANAKPVDLPKIAGVSQSGPSFNTDDSSISSLGLGSGTATGIYTQPTSGGSAATEILKDALADVSRFQDFTYWTTTTGRGMGGGSGWSLVRRHKTLRR